MTELTNDEWFRSVVNSERQQLNKDIAEMAQFVREALPEGKGNVKLDFIVSVYEDIEKHYQIFSHDTEQAAKLAALAMVTLSALTVLAMWQVFQPPENGNYDQLALPLTFVGLLLIADFLMMIPVEKTSDRDKKANESARALIGRLKAEDLITRAGHLHPRETLEKIYQELKPVFDKQSTTDAGAAD